MNKVVYNECYGGLGISYKAYKWLIEHGMEDEYLGRDYNDKVIESRKYVEIVYDERGSWWVRDTKVEQHHTGDELNLICHIILTSVPRHHPLLVQCVEELKEEASGPCSKLHIYELSGNSYRIEDQDRYERVVESCTDDYIVIEESKGMNWIKVSDKLPPEVVHDEALWCSQRVLVRWRNKYDKDHRWVYRVAIYDYRMKCFESIELGTYIEPEEWCELEF